MNALPARAIAWHVLNAYVFRNVSSAARLGAQRPSHNHFCTHLVSVKLAAVMRKQEALEEQIKRLQGLLADAEVSAKMALSLIERNAPAVELDWLRDRDAKFSPALEYAKNRLWPAKRELEDLDLRLASLRKQRESYGLQLEMLRRAAKPP